MDNFNLLKKILLSDNACNNFKGEYSLNNEFRQWIDSTLPEIQDCFMPQNNPWHIYSVIDHILHSVENINRLSSHLPYSDRETLALTMLLHDIGKPKCHIKRLKGGEMIDSFFDHNKEGEKIADRFLSQMGVEGYNHQLIKALVYKHDIFMFIKESQPHNPHHRHLSKELILEEIKDFEGYGLDGLTAMEYLLMVGRADNLAQNPKMTGASLRLLDLMDDLLQDIKEERERD